MLKNPNLLDGAQITFRVYLLIPGTNGGLLLAGGTVLFALELIEYMYEN